MLSRFRNMQLGDNDLVVLSSPTSKMDDEDDFLNLLQLMLAEQQGEDLEDEAIYHLVLSLAAQLTLVYCSRAN